MLNTPDSGDSGGRDPGGRDPGGQGMTISVTPQEKEAIERVNTWKSLTAISQRLVIPFWQGTTSVKQADHQ